MRASVPLKRFSKLSPFHHLILNQGQSLAVLPLLPHLQLQLLQKQQQQQQQKQQSRAFFSLFNKSDRTESVSQETWIRVSNNIVAVKDGSLARVKRQEALEALEYWAKQWTKLGFDWSFRLLSRLVNEEAYVLSHRPEDELFLTQRHLGIVVANWSNSANKVNASLVLQTFDEYKALVPQLEPNARILGALLSGAVKKRDPNILDLVDTVLDRLEKNSKRERHPLSDSDITAIEPAIRATTRRGYFQSPERADKILERLERLSKSSSDFPPDDMKELIMSNLAKSSQPGAALRVEGMLKDLMEPSTAGYIAVLQAWARSQEPGAADRCFAILKHIQSQNKIKAGARCYTPVIRAFGNEQRPQEAEAVLQGLLDEYERTKDPGLLPSVIPFNALLYSWSRSGAIDAGLRAENILHRMSDMAKTTGNPSLEPDKISFTTVMSAWANSKHEAGAERAHQILRHMEELHQAGNESLKPDARSYSVTMEAWFHSGSNVALLRVQELFDQLISRYEAGDLEMKPNLRTYSVLLQTLAKYRASPERLDAVILGMKTRAEAEDPSIQPTSLNYKCVMEAWASSGRQAAPERIDALFQDLHNSGRKADRHMYYLLLHSWATSRSVHAARRVDSILALMKRKWKAGEESVQPNTRIYNIILKAWAHSKSHLAPRRAREIMKEISDERNAGNSHLLPSTSTFNYAIICCIPFNPALAQDLLEEMIATYKSGVDYCKPDETSYNNLIVAWSNSKHEHRTSQAALVFRRMENDSDGIGVRPNSISFSLMIKAFFNDRKNEVRAADMARGYLEQMIKLSDTDKAFRPTVISFNQVIVALLQSRLPDSDEQAIALLHRMDAMEKFGNVQGRKDVIFYSKILAALAQSNASGKFSRIHALLMEAARSGINDINIWTLHNILEACGSLSSDAECDDNTKIKLIKDTLAHMSTFTDNTFLLVFKALQTIRGHEGDVNLFYSMCVEHGLQNSESVLKAYNDALIQNNKTCIEHS